MNNLSKVLSILLLSFIMISATALAQDKKPAKEVKEVKKECCTKAEEKKCCSEVKAKCEQTKKECEEAKRECCKSKTEVKKENPKKK